MEKVTGKVLLGGIVDLGWGRRGKEMVENESTQKWRDE